MKGTAVKVNQIAAVDKAVDAPRQQRVIDEAERIKSRSHAQALTLLAQLDRIPDRADSFDPLLWDDQGLPT